MYLVAFQNVLQNDNLKFISSVVESVKSSVGAARVVERAGVCVETTCYAVELYDVEKCDKAFEGKPPAPSESGNHSGLRLKKAQDEAPIVNRILAVEMASKKVALGHKHGQRAAC